MLFHSIGFLFLFLPAFLLCLRVSRTIVARQWILGIFSLLFYAGGEPKFVLILVASCLIDFVSARKIASCSSLRARKVWLICSLGGNLGILGFFKYGAMIASNSSPIFDLIGIGSIGGDFYKSFILPAGISFYTFQSMSYTIDVYRKEIQPQRSLLAFLNYVAFVPQLIAGPIERYNDLAPQLASLAAGRQQSQFWAGLDRLALGIAQKLFIADTASLIVDTLLAQGGEHSFVGSWSIALGFGVQIYYDFSAYSHMAIGIGLMLGVRLTENFMLPYSATNIQEFWHRWHRTLSRWFRDYLYIPLGGSRGSLCRTYFNVLLTFAVSGLWHGAGWNFVFWGIFHGCYLVAYMVLSRHFPTTKLPNWLGILITFTLVHFAWILFRVSDSRQIFTLWESMLGFNAITTPILQIADLGFLTMVVVITQFAPHSSKRWPGKSGPLESALLWVLALFGIFSSTQIQQFIYFQF